MTTSHHLHAPSFFSHHFFNTTFSRHHPCQAYRQPTDQPASAFPNEGTTVFTMASHLSVKNPGILGRGLALVILCSIMPIVALVLVCCRMYSRHLTRAKYTTDDGLIISAMVSTSFWTCLTPPHKPDDSFTAPTAAGFVPLQNLDGLFRDTELLSFGSHVSISSTKRLETTSMMGKRLTSDVACVGSFERVVYLRYVRSCL